MSNKVALVTGAAQGIGKVTALALRAVGFTVYASGRRLEALNELKKMGCEIVQLDVTNEASMVAASQTIEAKHGAVDVLVNNAGYGLNGAVEALDLDRVRHQFETNVFGLVRLSQLVLPGMRRKGWGRVINVGSVGGTFTAPGAGAYHASKYAVEAFNDALRWEVRGFGVDVVLIQPTGVFTGFDKKILETYPQTQPGSPYAAFHANHYQATKQIFESNMAGVIKPELVAQTIVRAATVRKPQTRYKVGLSAYIYSGLRRLVSDRMWDGIMGTRFSMKPQSKVKASS